MKSYDDWIMHVIDKPAIDSLHLNLFIVTADSIRRRSSVGPCLRSIHWPTIPLPCGSGGGCSYLTFQRQHCYVVSPILIIGQMRRFIPDGWQSEVTTSLWKC